MSNIDVRRITPETISFRQVARIAGWADLPPVMIGFEHSVCSRRFPIRIAPNQRLANLLCDSLNDRYRNQPMMPRFGWLPENAFPAHESINIETSIRQAQTGNLQGEAATAIHSITKETEAVYETVAGWVGPDIISSDEPHAGQFYVFVRLFPGLRVSSPWQKWMGESDQDVESVMLSDAQKWAQDNWGQIVKIMQKQSRLRMGTPPRREDDELEAVERLLAEAATRAELDESYPLKETKPHSKDGEPTTAVESEAANEDAMEVATQNRFVNLLGVYTNNLTNDRFSKIQNVLTNENLNANEKLEAIHKLIPIPPTAAAANLGKLLGVSKQAICNCDWWKQNRKGKQAEAIEIRKSIHRDKAKLQDFNEIDDYD